MKIESFHVEIKDGNFVFNSETHKKMFRKWLSQWDGKKVMLEVSEKKSTRSYQQNRYYWFYLGIIAEETGHTTDELHARFKGEFLTTEIKDVLGKPTRVIKSTTTLSKGEFAEYLVDISALTGVELPDTSKYYGFSYHK